MRPIPSRRAFRAVSLAMALAAAPALAQERQVTVSGVGEVAATPDIAAVDLGVTHEAETAEAALSGAAEAARALLEALDAAGIAARDRRTLEIDLNPVHDRPEPGAAPVLRGYSARHRLRATIRDLDALGPTLDAAVAAGATEIRRVSFDVADRDALMDEARRRAVVDAEAAADLLAEAAGAARGPIVALDLGQAQNGPAPILRAQMAAADAATPVAPGEMTLRAEVRAIYQLD